ncbi:hypothetical protein HMPREF0578_0904 [Mobiluncus mulieris 28-1]|nr:hypothetical protein HMPREF0578_0904 [Mobiluncus mulieris 28-1]
MGSHAAFRMGAGLLACFELNCLGWQAVEGDSPVGGWNAFGLVRVPE